ncbi:MAG TPA: HAD-IA family hydrolase [Candidatus Dormibacteraeota bacterium]|nr:HAD-IA family hydrolase [Candidatus Dormibacteraeota bacterium]
MIRIEAGALLFDLDGTLVDSDAVVDRMWARWADEVGLDHEGFRHTVYGRRGHEVMAQLLPGRPSERNLADNQRMLAWEIEDTDGVVPIAGARELLARLEPARWAIVTSGTMALAAARIRAAGIPMPEFLVTAEQVVEGKPAPEGFLRGAELLGVVAGRCVAFEDSAAGLEAVRAAGMTAIAVGARPVEARLAARVGDLTGIDVVTTGDGLILTIG